MPGGRLTALLRDLAVRDVRFVVVGGVAAVLNGAPVQTFDLDLVYSRDAANVDRLMAFLNGADAIFRMQPERRLRPARSHLAAGGRLNLQTGYGPLDLLGAIGRNRGYEELLAHSTEMEVAEDLRVRVLDLETIVSIKEQLASEKDLAALPVLRETLRRKKR